MHSKHGQNTTNSTEEEGEKKRTDKYVLEKYGLKTPIIIVVVVVQDILTGKCKYKEYKIAEGAVSI